MQIVKDHERKVIEDLGSVEVLSDPSTGTYRIGTKGRGLYYMFHHLDIALETARKIEEEAAENIYETEAKLRAEEYNDNPYRTPVYAITFDLVGYAVYDGMRSDTTTATNWFTGGKGASIGTDRRLNISTGVFTNELFIDSTGETGDVFPTVEDAQAQAEAMMGNAFFHKAIEEYEQRLNETRCSKPFSWEGFGVFNIWEVRESGSWKAEGVDYAESPVWTGEPFNRSTHGVTDIWSATMGGIQQP